jgi:hypothetical protein
MITLTQAKKVSSKIEDIRYYRQKGKNYTRFQVLISCPVKGDFCKAPQPRWVDFNNFYKTSKKGICVTCAAAISNGRNLYTDICKKFPYVRECEARRRNGTHIEVKIACPTKGLSCMAIKPRWVLVLSMFKSISNGRKPGCCQSCSSGGLGHLDRQGYRVIYVQGIKCLEHRYIMEQILGRKLRKGETVHHKNGKRADNRKENLELRMFGNHPVGWSLRQMREYLKTVPKRLGGLK